MSKDRILLVGNKDLKAYIKGLNILIKKDNNKRIAVVARGNNMKKAIDLVEASRNKFLVDMNISIEEIEIYTEHFQDNGKRKSVSCIKIIIKKNIL